MGRVKSLRRGFTLIELLVVIAIIAILIGLLLPAVQKVRESSNRVACVNKMRQLSLAVLHHNEALGRMPTYHGVAAPANNSIAYGTSTRTVFGSWFVHIMPFMEQGSIHTKLVADAQQYTHLSSVNVPATGTLVSPGSSAVLDYSGSVWIPPVPGTTQWVQSTSGNGYTVWVQQTVGGSPGRWEPPPRVVTPARPAVYDPPGSGPRNGPNGIWHEDYKSVQFKALNCPSDMSHQDPAGRAKQGLVYTNETLPWGSTSYLANYNAFTTGKNGINALPQKLSDIDDGATNTVMFGEGYAWCDGRGRRALYAWDTHNLGLTYNFSNSRLNDPNSPVMNYPNGLPNPTPNEAEQNPVNFGFQIRPMARGVTQCPAGRVCCNNLTGQSGHMVYNISLCDGSVKSLSERTSPDTWRRLMLPRDRESIGNDW